MERDARDVEDAAAARGRRTRGRAGGADDHGGGEAEVKEDAEAPLDDVVENAGGGVDERDVGARGRDANDDVAPRSSSQRRRAANDKATIEALRRALSEKLPSSSTPQRHRTDRC